MDERWDEFMSTAPPPVAEIAAGVRRTLMATVPGLTEQVDPPDGIVAYGMGPRRGTRMSDLLFAIALHRAHVNLQFADGATLPGGDGLLEGTGKRIRHVKCRSVEDANRPALRALIEAQVAARAS